ncbi:MAG: FecR domain-containing protein [Rubripirellula sp.]
MSTPQDQHHDDFNSSDLSPDDRALVQLYIDGTITDRDVPRLHGLLKESRQARRYLRSLATLDFGLHELFANASPIDTPEDASTDIELDLTPTAVLPVRDQRVRIVVAVAALAACVLIAVGVFGPHRDNVNNEKRAKSTLIPNNLIAKLAQASELSWKGEALTAGTPIGARRLAFTSGVLRLEFIDGVEVTLQGPADFEVIGVGQTRLHAGLLAATVPAGAEGFSVETPSADVVDLGTAFGIELDEDGLAEVTVFDGEVEILPSNGAKSKRVQEGEAVQVSSDSDLAATDFDAAKFEKVWPVASGIVSSTGAFRFAPPWPRRMGAIQSDSDIFVLLEGYAQTLDEPIAVNITMPGEYRTTSSLSDAELATGTRIKCFLLQFKPLDRRDDQATMPQQRPERGDLQRIAGKITFDRPVLGIIVRGDDLRASDTLFSKRGGQIPQKGRALELFGTSRDDVVSLSDDRHTVSLDLAAFGIFADQIRVIVDQSLEKKR